MKIGGAFESALGQSLILCVYGLEKNISVHSCMMKAMFSWAYLIVHTSNYLPLVNASPLIMYSFIFLLV